MDVQLIEKSSGGIIATIPVIVQGQNYTPSEREYIQLAWKIAVNDRLVNADRFDDYTFHLGK